MKYLCVSHKTAIRRTACVALAAFALSGALMAAGCSGQNANTNTAANANASTNQEASTAFNANSLADKASNNNATQSAAQQAAGQSARMAAAQAAVEDIVAGYGSSVAVAVVPLDGTQGFAVNGSEQFVSASMIKLLILAEYMAEVDAGTINGSAAYTLTSDDIVGGTGILQGQGAGTTLTYDELVRYMIAYSDNTATNVMIDKLGMPAINARAAVLGLSATDLQRYMMQLNSGVENHISANDAATLLKGIANGTIASATECQKACSYLLDQNDTLGIIQGLPDGVAFGHKTGDLSSIRHDGGIVYSSSPYVIVVLTELGATNGNAVMAQVSDAVYSALEA